MDASLNHGNSLNGANSSCSPTKIQNPWVEMLVTSTWEVLRPGAADFIQVLLNQILSFGNLLRLEAVVRVEFNSRFDPELRLPVSMLNMDMRPPFFSREEIKAEPSNAQDCRAHIYRIPEPIDEAPVGLAFSSAR